MDSEAPAAVRGETSPERAEACEARPRQGATAAFGEGCRRGDQSAGQEDGSKIARLRIIEERKTAAEVIIAGWKGSREARGGLKLGMDQKNKEENGSTPAGAAEWKNSGAVGGSAKVRRDCNEAGSKRTPRRARDPSLSKSDVFPRARVDASLGKVERRSSDQPASPLVRDRSLRLDDVLPGGKVSVPNRTVKLVVERESRETKIARWRGVQEEGADPARGGPWTVSKTANIAPAAPHHDPKAVTEDIVAKMKGPREAQGGLKTLMDQNNKEEDGSTPAGDAFRDQKAASTSKGIDSHRNGPRAEKSVEKRGQGRPGERQVDQDLILERKRSGAAGGGARVHGDFRDAGPERTPRRARDPSLSLIDVFPDDARADGATARSGSQSNKHPSQGGIPEKHSTLSSISEVADAKGPGPRDRSALQESLRAALDSGDSWTADVFPKGGSSRKLLEESLRAALDSGDSWTADVPPDGGSSRKLLEESFRAALDSGDSWVADVFPQGGSSGNLGWNELEEAIALACMRSMSESCAKSEGLPSARQPPGRFGSK